MKLKCLELTNCTIHMMYYPESYSPPWSVHLKYSKDEDGSKQQVEVRHAGLTLEEADAKAYEAYMEIAQSTPHLLPAALCYQPDPAPEVIEHDYDSNLPF